MPSSQPPHDTQSSAIESAASWALEKAVSSAVYWVGQLETRQAEHLAVSRAATWAAWSDESRAVRLVAVTVGWSAALMGGMRAVRKADRWADHLAGKMDMTTVGQTAGQTAVD